MNFTRLIFALFSAGLALSAQSSLTCSSDDMMRHYCAADTRGGVQLVRQRSDARCIEGSTWGYDRRGIWVDRGCRADFNTGVGNWNQRGSVGSGGYYGYGRNGGYGNYSGGYNGNYSAASMNCSSDDMRRHYCAADTKGGVRLVRQRSDAACVEGSTWGYDRRGIWVDRGCRADFQIGVGSSAYGRSRTWRGQPYYGGEGPYRSGRYNNYDDNNWYRRRPWN